MDAGESLLLQTRLIVPPPARQTLARPRLTALLDAPESRLMLLSAPAGFGKTTLLSSWCRDLAEAGVAVAWLTLEAGDNDPRRFLAYLRAALAPAAGPPPAAPSDTSAEPALTRLINTLAAAGRPAVLVLDDYHVIHAPAVHMAVAFLLEHLPQGVRLAIGSRADPPLPLARLRVRGLLAELRAADLRFTQDELAAFFAASDLVLSPEELAAVDAVVEGWPAGGRLIALARRHGTQAAGPSADARPAALLAGSQAHLFSYLAEEVFAGQPAHRKTFLLQTAILDQLCGPLCDAVLGMAPGTPAGDSYSRLVLDELDHANLFVVALDGERRWFRTHQLFRAFLREQLTHEPPQRVATLHERASAWYAAAGQTVPAVEHALAAGALGRAATLIEGSAAALVACGEYATLRDWLARLPDALRDERPALWLWDAWAALLTGAVDEVEPALARAERRWGGETDRSRRGEAAHLRAHLARLRGDGAQTIAAAERALADLAPDAATQRAGSLLALGCGRLLCGDGAAEETLTAALDACRAHNFLGGLVALRGLGDLARQHGRLDAAEQCYREALALAGDHPIWEGWGAQVALGELAAARGDLDGALALLRPALAAAASAGVAVYLARGHMALAQVLAARGDRAAADDTLRAARQHARTLGDAQLLQRIDAEAARLAQARYAGAHLLVEPLSEREREVLALVARGASNQAIAEALIVSLGTVKSHINHILGKLGARSRTEAVANARAHGLIT